jgi:hypothetical protein
MVGNKVLISVTTGEYARRADFYDYFHLMKKSDNSMVLFCHDRSPAHGRNMIVDAAREQKCTHILFIDDDMAYTVNALEQLLEHDKDIVSGLYLSRAYPHQPMVFDIADDTGAAFPMYLENDETNERLKPIVAAGFGFVLIKMSVFDKLEKPYVRLGELVSDQWCDDIGFFKRTREAGIQSYVDMECKVGHMGTMIIWPSKDKAGNWYSTYDTGGTGAINTPQIVPTPEYKFEKK